MAYQKSENTTRVRIEDWETPDNLIILQGLARDGITMEDIATKRIGISKTTLYEWMKKSVDISNALKNGREIIIYQLENKLVEQALKGDTTCLIFALKNMRSGFWKDRHESSVDFNSGDVEISIKANKEEK